MTDVRPEIAPGNYRMVLEAGDAAKLTEIEEAVKKKIDLTEWTSSTSGNTITWNLPAAAQSAIAEQATEQAKKIIESRLDAVGVAEPLVQRHGAQSSHQILVQMPGIQDPERVKELLKAESKLELVHVVSPPSPATFHDLQFRGRSEAVVRRHSSGKPARASVFRTR